MIINKLKIVVINNINLTTNFSKLFFVINPIKSIQIILAYYLFYFSFVHFHSIVIYRKYPEGAHGRYNW